MAIFIKTGRTYGAICYVPSFAIDRLPRWGAISDQVKILEIVAQNLD